MANAIVTECRACEGVVTAETLARYSAVVDPMLGAPERITFARCPRCNSPLLIAEEFYGNERGREVWSDPYRLYPAREDLLGPRIPHGVRTSYQEAVSCFKARAYTAATMMCHRALEAACAENNVRQPTLAAALGELRTQGLIEPRMLEWADSLPHVIDRAVHTPDTDISRDDARDAIEFTDTFLAYLYGFRERLNAFRRRRGAKSAETPTHIGDSSALTAAAAAAASRPSNGDRPT